jgi:hypothetical protein
MMKTVAAVMVVGAGLLSATTASAQTPQWTDKAFLNVSGGVQVGKKDATTTLSFPLYDETATIETSREVKGSPIWDVTGGVRVWNNFGVGLSLSGRKATSDGVTTASIPHPLFYDQARTVTGSISDMEHKEFWAGLMLAYMYPVTDKFEVMALLGPAVAMVKHEAVNTVDIVEGGTPTVTVGLETLEKDVWGFMAGLDGRYLITNRIGAGMFIRYASATANLSPDLKLKVGGFQVGAGVRVKF